MPVIINEIEVAVEVVPVNASSATTNIANNFSASKEDIIKECVEKVMEILNQKTER